MFLILFILLRKFFVSFFSSKFTFPPPMLFPSFFNSYLHRFLTSIFSFLHHPLYSPSSSPLSIILSTLHYPLYSPLSSTLLSSHPSFIRSIVGEHLWPPLGGSNGDHRFVIRLCRIWVPPPLSPRHQHGSEERWNRRSHWWGRQAGESKSNLCSYMSCVVLSCNPQHSCAFARVYYTGLVSLPSNFFLYLFYFPSLFPSSFFHFLFYLFLASFLFFSLPIFNFSSSLPLFTHSQHPFLTPTPTLSTLSWR